MILKYDKEVMIDPASIAIRLAIKCAKHRKSSKVTGDDLLIGLLQAIGRFGTVQIGPIIIDLEELEEALGQASQDITEETHKQRVSYSSDAVTVFERAAQIARKDDSPKVQLVHFLVAFSYEDNNLMARLKEKYGFSNLEWRSALSKWQPISLERRLEDSEIGAGRKSPVELERKDFLSPDEAAEFLDVHTQTIRAYIRTGKLPALRLAGERALRIRRSDLLALLEPYKPEEK